MRSATDGPELRFNKIMHAQVMGSHLVCFQHILLLAFIKAFYSKDTTSRVYIYIKQMIFLLSLIILMLLSPSFPFIPPFSSLYRWRVAFLDELVECKEGSFINIVYRNPTFTGFYTNWNSFVLKLRNIILISTLVHRVLMIVVCKIISLYMKADISQHLPDNPIFCSKTIERFIPCFVQSPD